MPLFYSQQYRETFRFTLLPDWFNICLFIGVNWVSQTQLDINSDLINKELQNAEMTLFNSKQNWIPHLSHYFLMIIIMIFVKNTCAFLAEYFKIKKEVFVTSNSYNFYNPLAIHRCHQHLQISLQSILNNISFFELVLNVFGSTRL